MLGLRVEERHDASGLAGAPGAGTRGEHLAVAGWLPLSLDGNGRVFRSGEFDGEAREDRDNWGWRSPMFHDE